MKFFLAALIGALLGSCSISGAKTACGTGADYLVQWYGEIADAGGFPPIADLNEREARLSNELGTKLMRSEESSFWNSLDVEEQEEYAKSTFDTEKMLTETRNKKDQVTVQILTLYRIEVEKLRSKLDGNLMTKLKNIDYSQCEVTDVTPQIVQSVMANYMLTNQGSKGASRRDKLTLAPA